MPFTTPTIFLCWQSLQVLQLTSLFQCGTCRKDNHCFWWFCFDGYIKALNLSFFSSFYNKHLLFINMFIICMHCALCSNYHLLIFKTFSNFDQNTHVELYLQLLQIQTWRESQYMLFSALFVFPLMDDFNDMVFFHNFHCFKAKIFILYN